MLSEVYFLAIAFLAGPVSAFWRLPCKAPIVVQRADPVVNPGKVSSHAHTIMGGNGFGFDMNYQSTQASTCSSCMVTKDFSNYWVPTLYYKAKNGSFIAVEQDGGALVYYLQRSDPKDPEYSSGLLAYPEGFRMLAGNPLLRNYTDTLEQQAVTYACLGTKLPQPHGFPAQNCPLGIRTQVFFPSCWDGVNLDSPNHKSHMAYPSGSDSGACPPSHPKRFVSLYYEVIWKTQNFADMWYDGNQPFVWASGDPTGYGFHGDFVNGWDVPTLQKAVTECNAESGVIEECKVFEFFSDEVSQGCKIPASVDEQIDGILDALPGCNPVQNGPGMAKPMTGCGAPTTIGTPQYKFIDLTVTKGFEYLGCGPDIVGQARTLGGATLTTNDMTNEKCVDYCVSKGFSIAGTEYSTECHCGNSVLTGREPVPGLIGNCEMRCSGDSKEFCGGSAQISLYRKCGNTCSNILYTVNNSTSQSGAADSGTGASPVASMASTATPSSPASLVAAAKPEASSAPGSAGDIVVATETRTVIPLASVPTPDSTACPKECLEPERITVTVALTTVTVTADVPGTFTAMEATTTKVSPFDDDGPLTTLSAAPELITPSNSAPYRFSNGTSTSSHHHHHSGTGHHSHIHSHATSKRRH